MKKGLARGRREKEEARGTTSTGRKEDGCCGWKNCVVHIPKNYDTRSVLCTLQSDLPPSFSTYGNKY